jgi:type IV secretion system protein VirB9
MKKVLILSLFTSRLLIAGEVPPLEIEAPASPGPLPRPVHFSAADEKRALSEKEKKAAELAKQWIEAKSLPVRQDGGKIVYLYGATLPTVICAPLSMCDIELEPGEAIIGKVLLGDAVRWQALPATSGIGTSKVSHVVIKPFEAGLNTTLMITTSRRTYHIKLVSQTKNWMPRIGFIYPNDIEKEWQQYNAGQAEKTARNTIPDTKENLEALNFEYEVSGSAPWKPVRVYNDGVKTIIQMPKAMSQTEAPALLVVGTDGNKQIVNYRLKKDRYIVDQIFAKAMLIAGVGSSQTSITITYKESQVYKDQLQREQYNDR